MGRLVWTWLRPMGLLAAVILATQLKAQTPFELKSPPPATWTNEFGLVEIVVGGAIAGTAVVGAVWIGIEIHHAIGNIASNRNYILTSALPSSDSLISKLTFAKRLDPVVACSVPGPYTVRVEATTNFVDWFKLVEFKGTGKGAEDFEARIEVPGSDMMFFRFVRCVQ